MRKTRFILASLSLLFLFSNCEDDVELPYKTYSAILNQENDTHPSAKILINELSISITWTRLATGIFRGVLSRELDLDKTTLIIQLQEFNRIPIGGFIDSKTIEFHNCDRFNLYDTRDGLSKAVIEIKAFN
jgi:hypothetical protein